MIRSQLRHWSLRLALGLAVVPWVQTACSSDQHGTPEATTGTLSMPLVTQSNGHTYRLTGNIVIYGTEYTQISMGDETEIKETLPTGGYFAYLNYFQLERLDETTGEYKPVSANLVSSYYQSFTIYNRTTTTISFDFETDGVVVTLGSGNLNVDINVSETPPVCTILGTDCPDGTWCAPPELTGQPLSCVYSGFKAAGEACNDPTECAANSSCYDFSEGPVCAPLCAPSEFGSACSSGGTCTKVGDTYGICVPDGGTVPADGNGGAAGESGAGGGGCGGMGASAGKGGRGGTGGCF
ncbi:MAG TPA: hypothetical protein VGQ57_15325 [Polyangiaceae bacterium]|nr:hypothetical protein [Polyangiaceae bacterium]